MALKLRRLCNARHICRGTKRYYLALLCILICIIYWYVIEEYFPLPSYVTFIPRKYDDFPIIYPQNSQYPFGTETGSLPYRTLSGVKFFETPTGHHIFHNVCIFPHGPTRSGSWMGPFEGHVHAVSNKHNSAIKHTTVFPLDTVRMATNASTSYWMIEPYSGPISKHWAFVNTIAVFPSLWRAEASLYELLMQIFPALHGLLSHGRIATKGTALPALAIAPDISGFQQDKIDALKLLGFQNILDFKSVGQDAPVCFSHAVFGVLENEYVLTSEPIKGAKKSFEANYQSYYPSCDKYHVLFLQRLSTRKILDLDFLVNMFKESGYDNVIVKSFEGLTLFEQLNVIHCTSVFIAVQGAGLAWYEYLPNNATVVELIMASWPSRYKARIAKTRPDIQCINLQCLPETSWLTYQKLGFFWFWRPFPVITESVKRKFILRSRETWPITFNIWKDSDCWCSPQFFLNELPKLDRIS